MHQALCLPWRRLESRTHWDVCVRSTTQTGRDREGNALASEPGKSRRAADFRSALIQGRSRCTWFVQVAFWGCSREQNRWGALLCGSHGQWDQDTYMLSLFLHLFLLCLSALASFRQALSNVATSHSPSHQFNNPKEKQCLLTHFHQKYKI